MSGSFSLREIPFPQCFPALGGTLILALGVLAGSICAAQRQPREVPLGLDAASPHQFAASASPVAALLPQAAQAPAPTWVKPGLRLTFYLVVASIPGRGKDWHLDPHGDVVDAEGRLWKGSDKLGVGGHGYNQYDIVAQDSQNIAIVHTNYLVIVQEPLAPVSQEGMRGPASTGGDLWTNPTLLKQVASGMHGGVLVSRAPYKIGDTNRDAVWIHQGGRTGSTLYVYDLNTGVLLHFSSVGTAKGSPIVGPEETENTGNTVLAQTTLTDQRMLNLPWMRDNISEWTAHLSTMRYQGTLTTTTRSSPIGPVRQPIMETMTPQSHGTDWAMFTASIQFGQPVISSHHHLLTGAAQIGGLWISPTTLARLQPGQELDRDPVTKFLTRVGQPQHTANGRDLVVISIIGTGFQFSGFYDRRLGGLVAYQELEEHSYVTKRTQMVLTGAP